MTDAGLIGLMLIIVNVVCSYKGFKNRSFYEAYKFEVEKILVYKDYKRIITSGFLHTGWPHLLFNMLSLFIFSGTIEAYLGGGQLLLIYFASLIGGELLSLFIHRNQGDYTSVGASGAVCGLIFASIALFPGMRIGFFIIPLAMPAWIYGLLFVAYTLYGIKARRDNVGHDAHLGGALIGMATAILLYPSALVQNALIIALITLPILVFIYLIVTRPHFLLVDGYFSGRQRNEYSIDHRYNRTKVDRQQTIDQILDKINKQGYDRLTEKEKQILKRYSQKP